MKYIEIVSTKSKKKFAFFSWLIMWWTDRDISHVARRALIGGEVMYYQASEGKVNYEHSSFFEKKHKTIREYRLEVPDHIFQKIISSCLHECGGNYGIAQNIGIAMVDIANKLRINIKNPFVTGRVCSELLYAVAFKELIPSLDWDENTIKPHQIEEIINTYFKKGKDGIYRLSLIKSQIID